MNRRLILLASMLFAAATFAFGPTASAQVDTCCARIHNNTNCHAVICVRLPGGNFRCADVMANTDIRFQFPCDDSTAFVSRDACGVERRLILNQRVLVVLRGGCCAHIVLRRIEGCYDIEITQTGIDCGCGLE